MDTEAFHVVTCWTTVQEINLAKNNDPAQNCDDVSLFVSTSNCPTGHLLVALLDRRLLQLKALILLAQRPEAQCP
jgi:hypothetical protein